MKRQRGALNRSFSIGVIRPPLPQLPKVAIKGSLCMGCFSTSRITCGLMSSLIKEEKWSGREGGWVRGL